MDMTSILGETNQTIKIPDFLVKQVLSLRQ